MGYGDTGPYGATDVRTPSLDRLAAEGVVMTDAYSAAPICSPARAALLTGRCPARLGLEANVNPTSDAALDPAEVTVAEMLRANGYATGMVGKWHLGFTPETGPNAQGFDEFFGFHSWSIDYYSHRTIAGEPGLRENTAVVEREGYATELFTEEAVEFVNAHSDEPFFLYVAYNATLPPHQPPGRPDDVRTQATWWDGTRADYVAVVEALDEGIGRVLDAIDAAGIASDTLVAFSYDHGGRELSRPDPLFNGFSTLWEGGVRVPLILRWPGRFLAGTKSPQIASLMDLTPTILAATGMEAPDGIVLDGIDLSPVLAGASAPIERTLAWRTDYASHRQRALRRGEWKYVQDGTMEMLFAIEEDPGERRNLAYRHPEVLAELQAALSSWEREFVP